MMKTQNFCTSNDIAVAMDVTHDQAKVYVDILRGRNFVIYQQTNEVKRIDENFNLAVEYVVNYPLEIMLPLIKTEVLGVKL